MGENSIAVNLNLNHVGTVKVPPCGYYTLNAYAIKHDDGVLEIIVEIKPTNVGEGRRSNGENENQSENKSKNLFHWRNPPWNRCT